jgi:hypothetical protein
MPSSRLAVSKLALGPETTTVTSATITVQHDSQVLPRGCLRTEDPEYVGQAGPSEETQDSFLVARQIQGTAGGPRALERANYGAKACRVDVTHLTQVHQQAVRSLIVERVERISQFLGAVNIQIPDAGDDRDSFVPEFEFDIQDR